MVMKQVAISEFKAKCLKLLDEVNKTKQPLVVTKHGNPLAEVTPVSAQNDRSWIGSMAGKIKITGDIVAPVIDLEDIEVYRD